MITCIKCKAGEEVIPGYKLVIFEGPQPARDGRYKCRFIRCIYCGERYWEPTGMKPMVHIPSEPVRKAVEDISGYTWG